MQGYGCDVFAIEGSDRRLDEFGDVDIGPDLGRLGGRFREGLEALN